MRRLLLELANYLYYLSIFVFPIKKIRIYWYMYTVSINELC